MSVTSSPIDVPEIRFGFLVEKATKNATWRWLDVSSPIVSCSEMVRIISYPALCYNRLSYIDDPLSLFLVQVRSLLSSRQFDILKIPVKDVSSCLTKGIVCNMSWHERSVTFLMHPNHSLISNLLTTVSVQ